ncbi:uncharacterized protein LOC131429340 [Malaya genurostris]|uniref:uncharacterized protein LOC131429340 n=1 Tax=Malaya genurostris TaxID=325434 RepID=UPI0026F3867E|nr:uncharacterized protein LOC131429340 [Malaya genurostris]
MTTTLQCGACAKAIKEDSEKVFCYGPCGLILHLKCTDDIDKHGLKAMETNRGLKYLCHGCRKHQSGHNEILAKCNDIFEKMNENFELWKNVFNEKIKLLEHDIGIQVEKAVESLKHELSRKSSGNTNKKSFADVLKNDNGKNITPSGPSRNLRSRKRPRIDDNDTLSPTINTSDNPLSSVSDPQSHKNDCVIVVRPKETKQSAKKTKCDLSNHIDRVLHKIQTVREGNSGSIILGIKCADAVEPAVADVRKKLGENYEVSVPKPIKPRLKIVGVADMLSESELMECVKDQNKSVNLTELKLITCFKSVRNDITPMIVNDVCSPDSVTRLPTAIADPVLDAALNVSPVPDAAIIFSPGKAWEGICPLEATLDTAPPQKNSCLQPMTENDVCNPDSVTRHFLLTDIADPDPDATTVQLKIYYQNVRGLRTKIDDFFVAVYDAEFDVIVLSETWLNDDISSLQLFGSGYTVYRNDRDSKSNICNLFAKHFLSVFETISFDPAQMEFGLRDVPCDIISLGNIQFTCEEIIFALKKLKSSTSTGPDGIPAIILKRCANALCVPLKIIFNKSLSQGIFPQCWKKSYMFPVFKKGNKQDVANYRGITSLCAGSKLFEILVSNVLFEKTKSYISTDQHGFFPGRSTATNLVQFTSHCIRNIEDGAQVDTVYTDLKAAFDRVDHTLLLAKIRKLGASETFTDWLKSYLVGRSLSVKLGNCESNSFSNLSGVPQGSNLGPILFSLFYNDICFALPPGCRLVYADDLKLFHIIRSEEDCMALQRQVDVFSDWCTRNRLTLSISKCSVISFTRKKEPILWRYTIFGEFLERVSIVRDLGVVLDSQLSFRDHYSHIIAQANRNLGFIFKIAKEFSDPYCLRSLYFTLVRSVLEASSVIWCPYADVWINRIESIQAKFLRYALRSLPWRNPTELPPYTDRCRLLGMDTLSKRRNISRAVFIGKLLMGQIDAPNILSQVNINVPPRTLRSRNFLRLDYQRTDYGQNEPIRGMCNSFNSAYECFDFSISCDVFKNRLRRLL